MPEIEARSAFDSISRPTSPISSILNFREPIRPKDLWYQCLINFIRQCMILEIASLIILILLLKNSYDLRTEHQKDFEIISLQITNLEKRLNRHVFSTTTTEEKPKPETRNQTDPPVKPTKPEKQIEFKRERFLKTALTLEPSTSSIRNFNAANLLTGARVDSFESSKCVDSWFHGCENETYTILEREPVPNKAWCTDDKNAHLTITLSKYIHPIAVSYQHVKWSGTPPDGTPKVYDVVACMDRNCDNTVPLVTDCEYRSSGKQEQFCTIPYNRNTFPTNITQFRFRENYGNVNVTCVYLLRVFGKQEEEVRELPKDHVQTCESLKWHRDNNPFIYKHFTSNTCETLYKNDCCTVCPECCEECSNSGSGLVGYIFFIIVGLLITFPCIMHLYEKYPSKRSRIRAI